MLGVSPTPPPPWPTAPGEAAPVVPAGPPAGRARARARAPPVPARRLRARRPVQAGPRRGPCPPPGMRVVHRARGRARGRQPGAGLGRAAPVPPGRGQARWRATRGKPRPECLRHRRGRHPGIVGKLRHLAPTIASAAAIPVVVAGLAGLGTVVARRTHRSTGPRTPPTSGCAAPTTTSGATAAIGTATTTPRLAVRRGRLRRRATRRRCRSFGMFDGFEADLVPLRPPSPAAGRQRAPRLPPTPDHTARRGPSPPATTPGPIIPPLVPPAGRPGPRPGPIPTPAPLAFTSAGWTPTAVERRPDARSCRRPAPGPPRAPPRSACVSS